MNEKKIEKWVRELEMQKFFKMVNRIPNAFYKELNEEERAEVIRRYRKKKG